MLSFDLQRFTNINTAASGTVLSSAQISAGKDSLGNDITSYVKTISGSDTAITVTKGSGDTYAVTLSGGSGTNYVAGKNVTINGNTITAADTNTTYSVASATTSGLISAEDKIKLNCIAMNVYSYARSPFDSANIVGIDLSHLVDGTNFEYETETDGTVKIRNGSASYNVNSGISRGYVEVTTTRCCVVKITYSIGSEGNYDYGGCIVSEGEPNTTFTRDNLKVANFFKGSGVVSERTAVYMLDANKTYYLNFGYAKDGSNNSNGDRFYIYEISINSSSEFSASVAENINKFFSPRIELQDRYARAPFDETNICNLDLSHLIDGENFELDTENLTDGAVTRIRSGSTSYNINNGISRGYVEVKTICACKVTVVYSISAEGADYGGCIVTEGAPNTTFTKGNLTSANFFYKGGKSANQTATYTLAANKTYYLNFGYAKDGSVHSNDDRFYIHSITVTPDCAADNEAEHFFYVASDFQDAVISGIGGKFLPSVSSMTEVLDNSANFQYMANKYQLLINYPQSTVSTASSKTFLGGATTLSFAGNGSTTHSIYSSLFDEYVSLTSDTSTTYYTYSIAKLTETAGFLTKEAYNNSTGTDGARSVIPFSVATTGKVSLGSNTSIQAAAASGQSSSWDMVPAIYDSHHILFLTDTYNSSGNIARKYTTIWFNGLTGAPTRTKALTDIGTFYSGDATGKTDTYVNAKPFGVSVEQYTYNSSGDQTKDLKYLLLHHGINKAVPVQYTYYTQTGDDVTIDKPSCNYNYVRIFFSKSRENCYILGTNTKWPSALLKLTPAKIDNAIKIYKINFATPEIYETTLKVSNIINDIF